MWVTRLKTQQLVLTAVHATVCLVAALLLIIQQLIPTCMLLQLATSNAPDSLVFDSAACFSSHFGMTVGRSGQDIYLWFLHAAVVG